jgi:hypothetical protein
LKATGTLVYKPRQVRDINKIVYTGCASVLPFDMISSSPWLRLVWRASWFADAHEFAPRKPFWFPKTEITLAKQGQMVRIV